MDRRISCRGSGEEECSCSVTVPLGRNFQNPTTRAPTESTVHSSLSSHCIHAQFPFSPCNQSVQNLVVPYLLLNRWKRVLPGSPRRMCGTIGFLMPSKDLQNGNNGGLRKNVRNAEDR